jgi:hypothetical protein
VIPGVSCIPVEVETVLLTPGDGGVEPTLGSTMLVDFAMGMDRDGVVSVALTDELTELLAMAEGETSSRPVVDEGAGVAVEVGLGEVRLGEGVKAVLVLATGNGRFVSDADTTLVLDVSESGRTDDDAPSKGALVSDAETKLVVDMSVKAGVSRQVLRKMMFHPTVHCCFLGQRWKSRLLRVE